MKLGEYALTMAKAQLALMAEGRLSEYAAQIGHANLHLAQELANAEDTIDLQDDDLARTRDNLEALRVECEKQNAGLVNAVEMPARWREQVREAEARAHGTKIALQALADAALAFMRTGDEGSGVELHDQLIKLHDENLITLPAEELADDGKSPEKDDAALPKVPK